MAYLHHDSIGLSDLIQIIMNVLDV